MAGQATRSTQGAVEKQPLKYGFAASQIVVNSGTIAMPDAAPNDGSSPNSTLDGVATGNFGSTQGTFGGAISTEAAINSANTLTDLDSAKLLSRGEQAPPADTLDRVSVEKLFSNAWLM